MTMTMIILKVTGIILLLAYLLLVFHGMTHYALEARKAKRELEKLKHKLNYSSLDENDLDTNQITAYNVAPPITTPNINCQSKLGINDIATAISIPNSMNNKIERIIFTALSVPILKQIIKHKVGHVNHNREEPLPGEKET